MRWNDGRIAVGLALLMWANPLHAAEISWRADFAAARKEAAAAAKPLLLDFGTESCLWCKKLDATTFRDRGLVELVAERFIPVKVDGERQEALTQSLGVQAFPTIVLLSAEGKVIGRHEGFADVAKMTALLRQAPGREVPKPSAAPRSPGIELLVQARADHAASRYLLCVARCDRVLSTCPGTAEAAEARRLVVSVAAAPERWRRVAGQLDAELTSLRQTIAAELP